jgi:hypothetical protein
MEAVQNFPETKTVKELKGFLGLYSYYRRFIHIYSKVPKHLYELLKDAVCGWKEPQHNAFQTLRFTIIFAQKGILSPQIITPGDYYKNLSEFPLDSST